MMLRIRRLMRRSPLAKAGIGQIQYSELPILSPLGTPDNSSAIKTGFRGNKMSLRAPNRFIGGQSIDLDPIIKGKYKGDAQMRQTISYFNEHIDRQNTEQKEASRAAESRLHDTNTVKNSPHDPRK